MNHSEAVINYLRNNPGRHTTKELAKELGFHHSSTSATCSELYTAAMNHGGAGVYGFKNPANPPATLYSWCHSRPFDADLKPRLRMPAGRSRRRPTRKQPVLATDETVITLTRSSIAPDVWVNGDQTYKLTPVTVTVTITEVNE